MGLSSCGSNLKNNLPIPSYSWLSLTAMKRITSYHLGLHLMVDSYKLWFLMVRDVFLGSQQKKTYRQDAEPNNGKKTGPNRKCGRCTLSCNTPTSGKLARGRRSLAQRTPYSRPPNLTPRATCSIKTSFLLFFKNKNKRKRA